MTSAPHPAELRALSLFADLPPETLDRLATTLRRRSERTGQRLMRVEEPGRVAYLIERGTAKVCADVADGLEVIVSLLGPGELVGEMSLIDTETRSATVEALEEMQLLVITRETFDELMSHAACARALLRLLARRLRLTNARLLSLATQDVTGRVAQQLAVLAREYHSGDASAITIPLRLTQGDLAALIGATRQSVNPVLVAFRRRGYISTDTNHRITVHQPAALERLSQR